jgi:shikimate kinase/3-dehydroquinate synthase
VTSARPHVLLSGASGVGKTTVGAALAARLGVPFVDVDARVEAALDTPIAAVFAGPGEAAFRAAEKSALAEALSSPVASVIAPGAGALVDRDSRDLALARALVVGLIASTQTRAARLAVDAAVRPLLRGDDLEARLVAQDRARREIYELVHLKVDATSDPAAVAEGVATAVLSGVVPLRIGEHAYAARLAPGHATEATAEVIRGRAPSLTLVVTDENVQAAHPALVGGLGAKALVVLPPGEPGKRLSAVERILEALAGAGADRGSLLVAVGGGVVSDLGGLAAALYARGIDWVAVPTTLLAMVDAAVGGKTGANLSTAKNLVGAFHHPIAVVVDPLLALTESPRAVASGLAEAVKTGLIGDPELFALLERSPQSPAPQDLARIVHDSLRVKARVVEEDPRERGVRALLNFGHTFGHAFEASTDFSRWTHGEAVGLGMLHALNIGIRLGVTPAVLAGRVRACLERLGLPVALDRPEIEAAHAFLGRDKKRVADRLGFVVVEEVGSARVESLPLDALVQASRDAIDLHEFGPPA